jgi:hypothetical protein
MDSEHDSIGPAVRRSVVTFVVGNERRTGDPSSRS